MDPQEGWYLGKSTLYIWCSGGVGVPGRVGMVHIHRKMIGQFEMCCRWPRTLARGRFSLVLAPIFLCFNKVEPNILRSIGQVETSLRPRTLARGGGRPSAGVFLLFCKVYFSNSKSVGSFISY